MKKSLLMKTMLLLFALVTGSTCAWAQTYVELYTADFADVATHSYTQNKTFTLNSMDWTSSVSQMNGGVFYLGCNSNNSAKGVLNNNETFASVVTALCGVDATYNTNKATAHAYALLFENAYSEVTKVSFSWIGTNSAFQVYLFGDSGSGWVKLANGEAANGTSTAGSIEWTGDATSFSKFAIVARPGTASSTAANKTLRTPTFTIYKSQAETGEETLVDIDASKLTNTDVYASSIAGFLKAKVYDSNIDEIAGAVVTWSSSDKTVATVGSDGSVTLVGAGTTTITASYAGQTGVYKTSKDDYELTVTNTNPNAAGTVNNPYTVAQACDAIDNDGNKTNVYVVGIVSKYYQATPTVNASGQLSYWISADGSTSGKQFEAYNGKYLDGASFTDPDQIAIGDKVVIYGTIKKYNTTYEADANNYIVKQISPVKEVGADGWATYVTTDDVEFEPENAFVVKTAGANATLSPVTKVPAGTPVILKGEGKKYAEALATAPAAPANELAISDGTKGVGDYVLGKKNGVAGFYKWNGAALASGKVYLPAPAGARDYLEFTFDGETTGLNEVTNTNRTNNTNVYDLQGRKVAQPTKGLYIVNGKKVILH